MKLSTHFNTFVAGPGKSIYENRCNSFVQVLLVHLRW